ncbi:MAG: hypothetical protein JO172_09680, partial [Hyphomicrobiales bacterium]|nr:hypothetical protein [Hyphomicrobiales bacterium]
MARVVRRPAKRRVAGGSGRADLYRARASKLRRPRTRHGRSSQAYHSRNGARGAKLSEQPLVSVNLRANELVTRLVADAAQLGLGVTKGASGETLIDAGSKAAGGIEAGLRIARICLGDLAEVNLLPSQGVTRWPWTIMVRSSTPVIACLASQYAGWSLAHGTGKDAFFALGSGPARA